MDPVYIIILTLLEIASARHIRKSFIEPVVIFIVIVIVIVIVIDFCTWKNEKNSVQASVPFPVSLNGVKKTLPSNPQSDNAINWALIPYDIILFHPIASYLTFSPNFLTFELTLTISYIPRLPRAVPAVEPEHRRNSI